MCKKLFHTCSIILFFNTCMIVKLRGKKVNIISVILFGWSGTQSFCYVSKLFVLGFNNLFIIVHNPFIFHLHNFLTTYFFCYWHEICLDFLNVLLLETFSSFEFLKNFRYVIHNKLRCGLHLHQFSSSIFIKKIF